MNIKMKKTYILGGAQTDYERNWNKEGKNVIGLLREVIFDGLESVGIDLDDIKSLNKKNKIMCFVGNFIAELYIEQGHLGSLLTEVSPAFYGVPSARYEAACASGSVALDAAISKIGAGDCEVAIVVGWEMMKTVTSKIGAEYLGRAAYYQKEAKGVDYPFPKLFGRLADEMIEKYGLDEKRFMNSLSIISDKNYKNAKKNPFAQTRNWYMDLKQASMRGTSTNPFVGGKLAGTDCSQITDGAAVVVLASEQFSSKLGKKYPVVKGYGHRNAPLLFEKKLQESTRSRYILPWTKQTIEDAYSKANLSMQDIDLFETHDCFTSSEYMAISAFGITEPGKEYLAVEDGTIQFGGKYPINPSGGLIGVGHPVGATGVRMFLDLYKQVTGNAGMYQVENARNAMMLNIGGTATTNYSFIIGIEN
jgi:acetyl-CoA C-acetyltransferase